MGNSNKISTFKFQKRNTVKLKLYNEPTMRIFDGKIVLNRLMLRNLSLSPMVGTATLGSWLPDREGPLTQTCSHVNIDPLGFVPCVA
jgi:hypothetical protein